MLTSFDGGRLFGQLHGCGRPRVLALHGWRRDHRDFDRVLGSIVPEGVPTLSGGSTEVEALPAIALDLPGFGATPAPETAWGSLEYAEEVAHVLSEMAPGVIVVGHSFGGRVAVHLAALHPESVGGVVLTGAPLFPANPGGGSKPPVRLRLARRLSKAGLVPEGRVEALKQRYGSADYRAASGVMRDILVRAIAEEREERYTEALHAVTCPVELIWGALDTAAPPRVAERIATELGPTAHLSVFDGIGHLTPDEIPGQLRAAIERLLASAPT